jgi:hypothetical protein
MAKVFPFSSLPTADVVIDAVYEGGTKGNAVDDVLGKLIPGAGNQGGFRAVGSWDARRPVILYQHGQCGLLRSTLTLYTGPLQTLTAMGSSKTSRNPTTETWALV